MGYVKNTWAIGDTITAEKLNTMEDGIANGVEPLDDDDLIDLLDGVSLFDAVYVTEDNVDKLLSDESGNILMW